MVYPGVRRAMPRHTAIVTDFIIHLPTKGYRHKMLRIARTEHQQVNMTLSMVFIAPGLVKAAVGGQLPSVIDVANLRDAPAECR